ncbi:hypothetical protein EDD80_10386 [Anseongella ginsenosidimutans]|uniref:Uncharacterized protein n=1 Tax=Anseongella ginsenosidimutans TaxID=496056 RepID=A0A4R3KSW3_9SPHI|nr:hypothetical protein EDD80_10386 [Anseongella ginsenosidimutans]
MLFAEGSCDRVDLPEASEILNYIGYSMRDGQAKGLTCPQRATFDFRAIAPAIGAPEISLSETVQVNPSSTPAPTRQRQVQPKQHAGPTRQAQPCRMLTFYYIWLRIIINFET